MSDVEQRTLKPITIKRTGTTTYEDLNIVVSVDETDGVIGGLTLVARGAGRSPQVLKLNQPEALQTLRLLTMILVPKEEASDDE